MECACAGLGKRPAPSVHRALLSASLGAGARDRGLEGRVQGGVPAGGYVRRRQRASLHATLYGEFQSSVHRASVVSTRVLTKNGCFHVRLQQPESPLTLKWDVLHSRRLFEGFYLLAGYGLASLLAIGSTPRVQEQTLQPAWVRLF